MKIIALSAISTISAAASAELSAGRPLRGGSPEDEARVLEGRRLSMSMIEESSAQEVAEGDGKYVWDGKWPASTTTEATKAGHDWGSSGKHVSKWSGSKSGKSTSGGKSGKTSSSKDSYWGGGPPSTSGKCLIAHINPLSVADEGVRFPDATALLFSALPTPSAAAPVAQTPPPFPWRFRACDSLPPVASTSTRARVVPMQLPKGDITGIVIL